MRSNLNIVYILAVVVLLSTTTTNMLCRDGKQLATTVCSSCHVLPQPNHLDKTTWLAKVFPQMRSFMGLDTISADMNLTHDVKALYPTSPLISEDEWFDIAQYYLEHAPDVLPILPTPPPSTIKAPFSVKKIDGSHPTPITSLVKLIPQTQQIVVGDGLEKVLRVYDMDLNVQHSIELKGPPSSLDISGNTWFVTDMGILYPHDSAIGAVVQIDWKDGKPEAKRILENLRRPSHVRHVDMDGDGKKDLLVCEYGNRLGRLGWFKQQKNGSYTYKELYNVPGAIRTEIHDINSDGKQDIVVQMAQAREGIFAWVQTTKGNYEMKELYTFPPSFGSSSFRMQDYNNDSVLDLVVTCGDNGDYEQSPFKPYHGTYFLKGLGKGAYEQDMFIPMYGAYGSILGKFSGTNNMDMVSVTYFPNYADPSVNIVRFTKDVFSDKSESVGIDHAFAGRWIAHDAADINQDGIDDIILGSVILGPGTVPENVQAEFHKSLTHALLLLSNGKTK